MKFLKTVKNEIKDKKWLYIPSMIILSLAIIFSIVYTIFRMSEDSSSVIQMVIIPIFTLLFFVGIISLVIYVVAKLPTMKPYKFALVLSVFLSIVIAGKIKNYDVSTYLNLMFSSLAFILIYIVSYNFKKKFDEKKKLENEK